MYGKLFRMQISCKGINIISSMFTAKQINENVFLENMFTIN